MKHKNACKIGATSHIPVPASKVESKLTMPSKEIFGVIESKISGVVFGYSAYFPLHFSEM